MNYPLQLFRLGIGNTNNNIIAFGSSLYPSHHTGKALEKWYLKYIRADVFLIINALHSLVMTANGEDVLLEDYSETDAQLWTFEGVENDYDGYTLYYKILNLGASSKALTYTKNIGFSLTEYSESPLEDIYQKFKINLDGLEGFAANCITKSGEKAGTIGGLFGPVVEVTTADELVNELKTIGPKTVVVNGNINMTDKWHTRIRDYKTLVGSFENNTLYDPFFRTNNEYGTEGDEPSDNIVIRNLNLVIDSQYGRILINIWSSRQIWIDHINFNNTLTYDRKGNGQDDVGKFIWLNTPYDSYMDAKDRLRSIDYITISYCKLTKKYWAVAYGTQNDEIDRDRTTLLYNWWNENVRRCPQLGNGILHVYNNYYKAYGEDDNGRDTTGIIGGDGSEVLSQNNMFNGYTKGQALMMGSEEAKNPARDDNSFFSSELDGIPEKINFVSKNISKWYPNITNYGYRLLDAYNTNNFGTKEFCIKYAGCFKSQDDIKYITDEDFLDWPLIVYDSPFLQKIDFDGPVIESESEPEKEPESKKDSETEKEPESKKDSETEKEPESKKDSETEKEPDSKKEQEKESEDKKEYKIGNESNVPETNSKSIIDNISKYVNSNFMKVFNLFLLFL